ncbi:hypothetical protein IAD21_04795 [Abditibacteriota bacterium]|nr:hypothetical protein IAD21_04795 [Abditibacteriota bacterium]
MFFKFLPWIEGNDLALSLLKECEIVFIYFIISDSTSHSKGDRLFQGMVSELFVEILRGIQMTV